ncbi:MAG: lytic transglycosylase domain-containing protein [Lysobacter sp.]|nr:lytic transglycosylase domain-containing protein [Lysobacter sp.]
MELMGCQGLAVPSEVMHHVVRVESSYNRYAIGVVGGRLVRQPRNLPEALATVRMLEGRGFNFSIGLAQVNRYNLDKYGLGSYEEAFEPCANLRAGSKILAECYHRAGRDWGKSFSCYYSGNFSTGFRHGYVQKIYASLRQGRESSESTDAPAIDVVSRESRRSMPVARHPLHRRADAESAMPAQAAPQPASAQRPGWAARIVSEPSRVDAVGTTAPESIDRLLEAASRQPEPVRMPVPASVDLPSVQPAGRAVAIEVGRAVPVNAVNVASATPPPVVAGAPAATTTTVRPDASSQVPIPDRAMILNAPSQDRAFVF